MDEEIEKIEILQENKSQNKIFNITKNILIIAIILVVAIVLAILDSSPETYIYKGKNIPQGYMSQVKSLGLIADDEKISYFYSNAIFDIKTGMYFVTNRNLVAYSNEWKNPKTIIDFRDITKITANYENTFLEDSIIHIETKNVTLDFPLSNEFGRDKDFVRFLEIRCHIPKRIIYTGSEIPKKYIKKIKSLGLLLEDEKIQYFYTDGIFGFNLGIYFATNHNLVIYSNEWEEPKTIIGFKEITKVSHNASKIEEVNVEVETQDITVDFSLPNNSKRMQEFISFIKSKSNIK